MCKHKDRVRTTLCLLPDVLRKYDDNFIKTLSSYERTVALEKSQFSYELFVRQYDVTNPESHVWGQRVSPPQEL